MDFIYRIPLLEFDPKDVDSINQHWEEIKIRIQSSSPSLFEAIQNKPYQTLSKDTKQTIYKYLLRGKYRSTPFGLWSAVGTAKWSAKTKNILSLSTQKICRRQDTVENVPYVLAQAIDIKSERLRYWFFDEKNEKWAYGILYTNKLIKLIITHYQSNKTLDYNQFSGWFVDIEESIVVGMWLKTIETGLIQAVPIFQFSSLGKTNLKSISKIQLDSKIRDQLDFFLENSGSLFKILQRPILLRFAQQFHRRYDDRFVSLSKLIHDEDIFDYSFGRLKEYGDQSSSDLPSSFTTTIRRMDLFDDKGIKLPEAVQDIQILFHIGNKGKIYFDNIVCNRPFVYSGRFTDDPDIHEIASKSVPNCRPDSPVFCDVEVFESETVRFLTQHRNVFEQVISPVPTQSKNEIPLSELYLGIVGNGRIKLVWKTKNKEVIPVFQHPLNGSYITHPLFRLLWEISNQHSVKFIPYLQTGSTESNYSPQLQWGKLVIQPKKWFLIAETIPDKTELEKWLKDKKVSSIVSAGNEDKELILDWTDNQDLELMWKELKKRGQLSILDASSVKKSPFKTSTGSSLHPQFVYQRRFNTPKTDLPKTLNYLEESDSQCLYYRINAPASTLLILIKEVLPALIGKLEKQKPGLKWYFVRYNLTEEELRLRVLDVKPDEEELIQSIIDRKLFSAITTGNYYRTTHYPEYQKYSKECIKVSEGIFHLESVLMVLGHPQLNKPLVCSSEMFRVKILSEIWSDVFLACGRSRAFLEILKNMLKAVPKESMRQIRKKFDPEIIPQKITALSSTYSRLICSHAWNQSFESQKKLLLNHFHMAANRLFQDHTDEYEQACRYLTYRKLGRAIHLQQVI
jgi:lantibiotic biosynthesis protein